MFCFCSIPFNGKNNFTRACKNAVYLTKKYRISSDHDATYGPSRSLISLCHVTHFLGCMAVKLLKVSNGSRHWRVRQEEEQSTRLADTIVKITRFVKRHLVYLPALLNKESITNLKKTCVAHKCYKCQKNCVGSC